MTQRALLYLRQSDSDGEGERSLSMDSQAAILREDAGRFGWHVLAELRDADLKGHDECRPGLIELYDRCRAGEVDVVAFWKLDRFARNLRLQENVVHELDRFGVQLYSNQEPWIGDVFIRQILGSVAEKQTRDISANVRRALRERMRRGLQQGNVPWGYVRPDRRSKLTIDPVAASEVEQIFRLYASGMGPAAVARDLTRRGVPTPKGHGAWRVCTVSRILRCATYRGAVCTKDLCIEDAHPAIVSPELWSQAQGHHQRPHRSPRENKQVHSWLEGNIEHACGLAMYLIQPHANRQAYFRCRAAYAGAVDVNHPGCDFPLRRLVLGEAERLAWQAVNSAFASLAPEPDSILLEARRQYEQNAPLADIVRREAEDRLARITNRRARAEDLYLSGSRDRAWFDGEDARIGAEIEVVEQELARLPMPPEPDAIESAWNELRTIADTLAFLDARDRGQVTRILGTVVVGVPGIEIRFRSEWELFFPVAHHKVH